MKNVSQVYLVFGAVLFLLWGCANETPSVTIDMGGKVKNPQMMYNHKGPSDLPEKPPVSLTIHIGEQFPTGNSYIEEVSERPYLGMSNDTVYFYDRGMSDSLYITITEEERLSLYNIFRTYAFDKMQIPEISAVYRCPCTDFVSLSLGDKSNSYYLDKPSGTNYLGVYDKFYEAVLTKKNELASPYIHSYTVITAPSIFRNGNEVRRHEYGAYSFYNKDELLDGTKLKFLEGQHFFNLEIESINEGTIHRTTLIDLNGKQDTIYLELDEEDNLVYKLL